MNIKEIINLTKIFHASFERREIKHTHFMKVVDEFMMHDD
jgi:hypothetical protein